MSAPVIEAVGLVKKFGDFTAVDDVSFEVPKGSVFGLLGPNGAGKTTTVRMMTTLAVPTSGSARVAGHDVATEPEAVRASMGLTAQSATVDDLLTGRENLRLIGDVYGLPRREVRSRADELLEHFSLTEAGDKVVKDYSGGMRRRIDLAVSLIAHPSVLFLDEPTTGLDPRSRVELWEVLRGLVRDGTTLQLTTQYLDEADQLADNIVVIDHGRIIAQGTPLELKNQSGAASLVVTVSRTTRCNGRPTCSAVSSATSTSTPMPASSSRREVTSPRSRALPPCSTRQASRSTTSACSARALMTSSSRSPGTRPKRPATRRRCRHECGHELSSPRYASNPGAGCQPAPPDQDSGPTQPHPHQAPARDAHRRDDPADQVRAAVCVRLRRIHRRAGRGLQALAPAGDHGADNCVQRLHRRHRAQHRHRQGHGRPTALAPDSSVVDFGVAQHRRAHPLEHRRRRHVGHRPLHRLADPQGRGQGPARLRAPPALRLRDDLDRDSRRVAMRSVEAVNGPMFTTIFPITFLSNAFARTEVMPPVLRTIAEWNPISALTQAMRDNWGVGGSPVRVDAPWSLHKPELATIIWSVAITLVIAPLALRAFNKRTTD